MNVDLRNRTQMTDLKNFLSLWDNPEDYCSIVFKQMSDTCEIEVVVEAPDNPVLVITIPPMIMGNA